MKQPGEQQTRCSFTIRTFNNQGDLVALSQKETAQRFQQMLDQRDASLRPATSPSEKRDNR